VRLRRRAVSPWASATCLALLGWVICPAAWAQEPPAGLTALLPPEAPADGAEMARRLARLPEDLKVALPGWSLAAPSVWGAGDVPARLGRLPGKALGYQLLWGVSAQVSGPERAGAVLVDVLCLADPMQALGAYWRLQDLATLAVEETVAEPQAQPEWDWARLAVWRGSYVVLAQPEPLSAPARAAAWQITAAVRAMLPEVDRKPLLARLMPASRLPRLSLHYWPQAAPDLPLLRQALTADYVGTVGGATLTLAECADGAGALRAYRLTVRQLEDGGESWAVPDIGGETWLVTNRAFGLCLVAHDGPYVVALTRITDRRLAEALLRICLTHIHTLGPTVPEGTTAGEANRVSESPSRNRQRRPGTD
jgi:hypothetical protein